MNRDLLNNASPRRVANACIDVLDRLQNYQPHEQIMAAAALFLSLAEAARVPAQDVFTATKNLINGVDGKRVEFRALDAYVRNEL